MIDKYQFHKLDHRQHLYYLYRFITFTIISSSSKKLFKLSKSFYFHLELVYNNRFLISFKTIILYFILFK